MRAGLYPESVRRACGVKHVLQHEAGQSQSDATRLDVRNGIGESRSVWLTASEASRYVGCRTVRAFYDWRKRHGLIPNGRGQFARRDLDKARAVPRKRHVMSPNSLINLRRRHASQDAPVMSGHATYKG